MFFVIFGLLTFIAQSRAQFPPVQKNFDGWGQPIQDQFPPPPQDGPPPPPGSDGRPPPPGPDGRPPPPFQEQNGQFGPPPNKWDGWNGNGWGNGNNPAGGQSVNNGVMSTGGRPCRGDMNSPDLPDCVTKYLINGVLIDGNGNKCGFKTVNPAKLDVNTLLSKAEQLVKSGQCQGEPRGGPPPGGRRKRQLPPQGKCGEGPGVGNCEASIKTRLQSVYAEKDMGDSILIVTNGIPDHCYHEGADNANPNNVCENYRAVLIPKKPRKTNTFRENPMGIVGIAKSGAFFFNHKSAEPTCNVAAITEKPTFDACDGHPSPSCQYHYHKAPVCIPGFDKCALLGYNNDGVGVYGKCNMTVDGQQIVMKSCYKKIAGKNGCDASHYVFDKSTPECNLDEANGFTFTKTIQSNGASFEDGSYAYFFTPEYPFIMPGSYGDRSLVQWCVVNP